MRVVEGEGVYCLAEFEGKVEEEGDLTVGSIPVARHGGDKGGMGGYASLVVWEGARRLTIMKSVRIPQL